VPQILPLRPSAVELIDRMVLEMTAAQLEYARRMTFVQGAPDAVLVVEFSGDDHSDLMDRLTELERRAQAEGAAYATVRAVTAPAWCGRGLWSDSLARRSTPRSRRSSGRSTRPGC